MLSQLATSQPQGWEEGHYFDRSVPSPPADLISYVPRQVVAFPSLLPFPFYLFQWHAFAVDVLGVFAAFRWAAGRAVAEISWKGWKDFVCSLQLYPRWSQCHQWLPEKQNEKNFNQFERNYRNMLLTVVTKHRSKNCVSENAAPHIYPLHTAYQKKWR